MLKFLSQRGIGRRGFAAVIAALCVAVFTASSQPAEAAKKESFRIAWSIYVGWMPWAYADEMGIVKKWADKYGIEIEVVQINDFIESINQFTAGAFDGTVMTNMDALSIPAGGGVDSTALILGDFSNGNDGLVVKGEGDIAALKGVDRVDIGFAISVADIQAAMARQGLASIKPGDVVLFHTGHRRLLDDGQRARFLSGQPGPGIAAARWLAAQGVVAVGGDSGSLEVMPFEHDGMLFPVHQILLAQHGVYLLENVAMNRNSLQPRAARRSVATFSR